MAANVLLGALQLQWANDESAVKPDGSARLRNDREGNIFAGEGARATHSNAFKPAAWVSTTASLECFFSEAIEFTAASITTEAKTVSSTFFMGCDPFLQ